jgi:hypothetical protein
MEGADKLGAAVSVVAIYITPVCAAVTITGTARVKVNELESEVYSVLVCGPRHRTKVEGGVHRAASCCSLLLTQHLPSSITLRTVE